MCVSANISLFYYEDAEMPQVFSPLPIILSFLTINLLCPSLITPSSPQETAEGKEDDEHGDNACPYICLARGGSDSVVLRNEALARKGVEDGAVGLQGAVACISNLARHRKGVGNIKPENVQAIHKLLVQLLAQRVILVEEHSVSIRVEKFAQLVVWPSSQDVLLPLHNKMYQGILKLYEAFLADGRIGDGIVVFYDEIEACLEEIIIQPKPQHHSYPPPDWVGL